MTRPTWTDVELDYEPYSGASGVFARSSAPFSADTLGKGSPARDQARQQHFVTQLRRVADALGSDRVPVFLSFRGLKVRLDKGCVGHAVAAGVLRRPANNAAGFVEHVLLHG